MNERNNSLESQINEDEESLAGSVESVDLGGSIAGKKDSQKCSSIGSHAMSNRSIGSVHSDASLFALINDQKEPPKTISLIPDYLRL